MGEYECDDCEESVDWICTFCWGCEDCCNCEDEEN